jgi:predicted pyridoxine 5'-phosphate oxidase superfamily flavin-nucleotide-binding protein
MKEIRFAWRGGSSQARHRHGPPQAGSRGEHILQQRYGTAERARQFYAKQVTDQLTPQMIEFIGRMEMAFIATSDAAGDCDCSFRAGQAGFLRVLDERTIAYPEFRGNGVMASLGNILDNPHVGILMVDFTHDLIGLHVNGDAEIVTPAYVQELDQDLSEPGASPGTRPIQWVLVRVTEAFIHCSKHIPKLLPQSRVRHWGTDNPRHKGGDYFGVAARNLAGQPAPSVGAARAADGRVPVPRPEHSGQQDRDRHEMTFML